jgi:hypothetical protein
VIGIIGNRRDHALLIAGVRLGELGETGIDGRHPLHPAARRIVSVGSSSAIAIGDIGRLTAGIISDGRDEEVRLGSGDGCCPRSKIVNRGETACEGR